MDDDWLVHLSSIFSTFKYMSVYPLALHMAVHFTKLKSLNVFNKEIYILLVALLKLLKALVDVVV
jgi:hypothetical protein